MGKQNALSLRGTCKRTDCLYIGNGRWRGLCNYREMTGHCKLSTNWDPATPCSLYRQALKSGKALQSGKVLKNNANRHRRRTFSEKIALEMHEKGATDREIAQAFGTARQNIQKWRKKEGLPLNRDKRKAAPSAATPETAERNGASAPRTALVYTEYERKAR